MIHKPGFGSSSDQEFLSRVRAYNKRRESALHRTFTSNTKKWREYYNVPSENATFTLHMDAPNAKKYANAAIILQDAGAQVEFI